MKKEEEKEKHLKEEIRKLRKRKPEEEGNLKQICEEMLRENYLPWKRRKFEEETRREIINKKEEEDWERAKRLNKAKWKKKDLIEQLERKKKEGKPIEWIRSKQKCWRKYRDRIKISEEEKEEIQESIIALIPERIARKEESVIGLIGKEDKSERDSDNCSERGVAP